MWRGHSVAAVAAAPPGSVHSLARPDDETTSPDTQTAGELFVIVLCLFQGHFAGDCEMWLKPSAAADPH